MELPNPIAPRVQQPPIIWWEEQLHDHNQKIEEYLRNRVFRGCTYESTVRGARTVLKRLFDLVPIEDVLAKPNIPGSSGGVTNLQLTSFILGNDNTSAHAMNSTAANQTSPIICEVNYVQIFGQSRILLRKRIAPVKRK